MKKTLREEAKQTPKQAAPEQDSEPDAFSFFNMQDSDNTKQVLDPSEHNFGKTRNKKHTQMNANYLCRLGSQQS
jgi:hypothetical protein